MARIKMEPSINPIVLEDSSQKEVIRYVKVDNTHRKIIFARVKNMGRIVLWEGETDVTAHINDTEQQLADRVKQVIES